MGRERRRGQVSHGMRNETSSVSRHAPCAALRCAPACGPCALWFPHDPVMTALEPVSGTASVISCDRFMKDLMHCDRRDGHWTCGLERKRGWEILCVKGSAVSAHIKAGGHINDTKLPEL